jgi:hypothetical protein
MNNPQPFKLEEVLEFNDIPVQFTCRDSQGNRYIATLVSEYIYSYIPIPDDMSMESIEYLLQTYES